MCKYDKKYYIELRKKLKDVLSKTRYEHTLGVEFTSAALAMRYSEDINKARVCGLLHDCAKCIDDDKKYSECIKYNVEVNEFEKNCKSLLHAKLGAVYAAKYYGIDDVKMLDAIKYHTTGRPNMTLLDKIVFVADYIEPSRDKAPNLENIRKTAFIDLDEAVLMILSDTLNYLKTSSNVIDKATQSTYDYYVSLKEKQ